MDPFKALACIALGTWTAVGMWACFALARWVFSP